MNSIIIRRATVVDADAMARVHIASWRATYAKILPQEFLAKLMSAIERKDGDESLRSRVRLKLFWSLRLQSLGSWGSHVRSAAGKKI